jgi:LysM repeat protein
MEKRTSAFARIFAASALAGAVVVVVIVVISSSLGDSNSSTKSRSGHGGQAHKSSPKTTAKTYVVKSGDTLVSIAHRTGVPVAHILTLNPEVDPQILIAGQTLKLR